MPVSDQIETERLRIRPFRPDDWPAVLAYSADEATMHYLDEPVMTEERARAWTAEQAGPEVRAVALVVKPDDTPVGLLVFHLWFALRTYEIGWVVRPDVRGNGHTTEGARALIQYAFDALNTHRVIATCQPENSASWRVMDKLGMRRGAHFRQCIARDDGTWWDEYFYAVLAEVWNLGSQ